MLGSTVALWASRLVKSVLYRVKAMDVLTYLGVFALLLAVGMLASLIPALACRLG